MQEPTSTGSHSALDFSNSLNSKIEQLVDVPFTQKLLQALVGLFNYFDIHAPRLNILHNIVTCFRFLQLIGGSVLAAKPLVFPPGTLTYKTMSIISALFHLIPVQYRVGNEALILLIIDIVLVVFAVYLVATAFNYKKTSQVSHISVVVLSVFIAFGPYLILPLTAQYAGQLISANIANSDKITVKDLSLLIITAFIALFYIWVIVKTFTTTIIFRTTSFQTLEGEPQNRIFVTTILITLLCALATDLSTISSTVLSFLTFCLYAFDISTVFRCGTFIKTKDQMFILGGSILGIIIGAINMYPCFVLDFFYAEWYFLGFAAAAVIAFSIAYFVIKLRERKDMKLLDEVENTQDIELIKSKGKFKQIVITGFNYCHPFCMDFTIFKLATNHWKDDIDVWAVYAKFVAIYPESSNILSFIFKNISMIKKNQDMAKLIQSNISNIINTRETRFTVQLKSKINKIAKKFNKSKNRLRNIWDLILQGTTNDMGSAIKLAYESVKDCETDVLYLKMLYPNNRFAMKQYARFLYEVKSDPISYQKTAEDIKKLQRGYRINNDIVHDLGIQAFPNLPEIISEVDMEVTKSAQEGDPSCFLVDDDALDLSAEQYETVSRLIESHRVPAISYMYMTTFLTYLFIFLIPMIGIMIGFNFYEDYLAEPLSYMQGIAYTRNIVNAIPCFTVRALFEELEDPRSPGQMIIGPLTMVDGFPCTAFGGEYNARKIIEYYASNVGQLNAMVSGMRSFKEGNEHLERVRDLLFKGIITYYRFLNKTTNTSTKISSVDVSYMLSSSVGRLLENPVLNAEVAKGPESLTVRNNNVLITEALSKALTEIVAFISDEYDIFTIIFWSIFGVLSFLSFVVFLLIYFLQTRKLEQNKAAIIAAISDLPKTTISNVSQSFNSVKGANLNTQSQNTHSHGPDSEINRQEESIIKLFSSITDGVRSSSNIILLICFLTIIGLTIAGYYCCVKQYFDAAHVVYYNCHHINYLWGSATFLFAMTARLYDIVLAKYHPNFEDTILDVDKEISEIEDYITLEVHYFSAIRLGREGTKEVPFKGLIGALDEASEIIRCTDPLYPPVEVPESTRCFTAAAQLYVVTCYFKKFASLMRQGIFPLPWGQNVNDAFQIGPLELHEAFFSRAGEQLVPYMKETIGEHGTDLMKYFILFFFLVSFIFCIIFFIIFKENILIKFTIHQLMRCQPAEILHNKRIMELLSGIYSVKDDEKNSGKHANFSNEVFNKLNDIFIVCQDETGNIIQVNSKFTSVFGIEQEQIENTSIKQFFTKDRFKCDEQLEKIFSKTTNIMYETDKSEKMYIEFSTCIVAGKRIYTGKDQTQNILHEKLISDEKKKSDAMLASILPANLVPRVQAGEKNISFSVQSVTVLFLDIVEFTPWCGSHDAHYVMRMLNMLFKEFDAITNSKKTMTKIKCIGDCYMAAGGIFDEVNQPAVHAKEVVEFGRGVINKLEEINVSENEKLRIRVGINTGGPIVAGVIGTEKPTFEILGPAINIAHEMEHHGVPMKVHISRPVYELIYGQSFDIKERGEIDVKGGKMFTYLVEPH